MVPAGDRSGLFEISHVWDTNIYLYIPSNHRHAFLFSVLWEVKLFNTGGYIENKYELILTFPFGRVLIDFLKQRKPFFDGSEVKVMWEWSPIHICQTLISVRRKGNGFFKTDWQILSWLEALKEDLIDACNKLGSSYQLFLLSKRDWMSQKFDSFIYSCCYHFSEVPFRWTFFCGLYECNPYISLICESQAFLQV